MESNRRPGAFSPVFMSNQQQQQQPASSPPSPRARDRSYSLDSDSSSVASSRVAQQSAGPQSVKRGPTPTQQIVGGGGGGGNNSGYHSRGQTPVPGSAGGANSSIYVSPRSNNSTPALQNYSRPTISHVNAGQTDGPTPGGGTGAGHSAGIQALASSASIASGSGSGSGTSTPLPPPSLLPGRRVLPINPGLISSHKRNNSQGFFEPSLPTLADSPTLLASNTGFGNLVLNTKSNSGSGYTSSTPTPTSAAAAMVPPGTGGGLTPSQIAAQAAMQAQAGGSNSGAGFGHLRKRSQTIPSPPPGEGNAARAKSASQSAQSPAQMIPPPMSRKGSASAASSLIGPAGGAAAAAGAAYAGQLSPGLTSFSDLPTEKATRSKAERAKQIFSKSKQITVPNTRDFDRREKPGPVTAKIPSPGTATFPRSVNASMTSLNDTLPGSASSTVYGMANSSTSTLVPIERMRSEEQVKEKEREREREKEKEKEKEKSHRTHIFSRPKKNRAATDETITLSSAASNSKPIDPSAPQSIYSFAQSPAPSQTSFSKTVTGLHGGRKKKEEFDFTGSFGQPSAATAHFTGGTPLGYESASSALAGFGLNNMSAEDAWDFLKAKILVIFEGEELRIPVEDLNRLVSIHLQRCVQRRTPIIIEDFRELLNTGFASLDMTLRRLQEDRLVPQLVDMWLFVFGTLLPYMQAVFLPLDLELRGHGAMSPAEAADFWGLGADILGLGTDDDGADGTTDGSHPITGAGFSEEMFVRSSVLLSFRDSVILPRHDALKQVFSRLSLESINVGFDSPLPPPPTFGSHAVSASIGSGSSGSLGRPGTAGSLDPGHSSYNSQGSTLVSSASAATTSATAGVGSALSDNSRSRATSNTSAPELPTFSPTVSRHQQHHHHQHHNSQSGSIGAGPGTGLGISSPYSTPRAAGFPASLSRGNLARAAQQQQQQQQPDSSVVTETVGRMLQCMSVLVSLHSDDAAQDMVEDLTKTLKLNWLGRGRTGRNRKGLVGARVPRRTTQVAG